MLLGAPYLHNYATRTRQAASRDSVTPLQFITNAGRFPARRADIALFANLLNRFHDVWTRKGRQGEGKGEEPSQSSRAGTRFTKYLRTILRLS